MFTLLLSVGLVLFYNLSFWRQLLDIRGSWDFEDLSFLFAFFVLLVAVLNLLLSVTAFRRVQKPVAIVVLIAAALAAYFMSTYGVVLDSIMIQNVFETDMSEISELISSRLLFYFLLLGVAPALAVVRTRIAYRTWWGELKIKAGSLLLSVAVIGIVGAVFYSDFAALGTNHHDLRHRITPENIAAGTAKHLGRMLRPVATDLETVGADAVLARSTAGQRKATLVILVVGEAARAREFSLNGYLRQTNPNLSRENIVNFGHVSSCGTSTAVSVPCMFSSRGRKDYRAGDARRSEGLLDVLARAGIQVLWRDNNSGCKGVCERVESQDVSIFQVPEHCDSSGCFDEALLAGLDDYLSTGVEDVFVVLHQKGSHGPAYYLRYPKEFERFKPVCATNQLQQCTAEEVVNAYDNSILYTDYFLSRVIQFLRERSDRYNTAMLYTSDHGESLGEARLYLHGLPYALAPDNQTRVPFLVWFSDEFKQASAIDSECLNHRRKQPMSHDNLFHSVLGLMNVETRVHDLSLDIFAGCRRPGIVTAERLPANEAPLRSVAVTSTSG